MDIFAQAKETTKPQWAKFQNKGDNVQGTYVGKIVGQKDGYGNEQIIYQLLQESGDIVNVGFGLNKKFIINQMDSVRFGQIIGFRYKGMLTVKDKFGKSVNVKDFGLHQDPKIINQTWLDDNKNSMPTITYATTTQNPDEIEADKFMNELTKVSDDKTPILDRDDAPFEEKTTQTNSPVTEEDKLGVILKLSTDKLGITDLEVAKNTIMEKFGIAFIPVNYDQIIESLKNV